MNILTDEQILDLFNQKLSQKHIMMNYKLSVASCFTYLLNEDYSTCDEDTYITINQIIRYQPHLTYAEFIKVIRERQKIKGVDVLE